MTQTSGTSKQSLWAILLFVGLILIDQLIKIWVKTHMYEGQVYEFASWARIYFIENEGMAYGITLGSKLFLTLFRLVAMSIGAYFLVRLIRTRAFSLGFVLCLTAIIAGGIGNIIDCLFYGELFSSSHGVVAHWTSWGEGYGSFLHGKVVDMFHFPMIRTTYPDWFPFYAGEPFVFFSPIFNFADTCISVGVACLFLFYSRTFGRALEHVKLKS